MTDTDHIDRETADGEGEGNDENTHEEADAAAADDAAPTGDEDDSSEEDSKPVTRGELNKTLKGINDTLAVIRRHNQKSAPDVKGKPPVKPVAKDSEDARRIDRLESIERKRTFGYENSLSPKEVDMVFKYDANPSKKTLQDPFVQGGLEKLRASQNVDANLPGGRPSGSTFKVNGKQWGDLKPEEKQANFTARRESLLRSKGRR